MKDNVQKMLDKISKGARPDLKNLKSWIESQDLSLDEHDHAMDIIEQHYNITPDAFDTATEEPGKNLDYLDDFKPIMHGVKGWLSEYVEHTKGMEAPTAFHFATGLTVLGAALRRKTYVDQGTYQLYPAMQTLIVGPSGKVKKSTAANYGVRLAASPREGIKPFFNLLQDTGTGEALWKELSVYTDKTGEATGLIYVSELSTFLNKKEYNIGLIQTITDFFDSPAYRKRKTMAGGDQVVKNVAISALFCSNEDWLADSIPASAFGGGFLGRMLVFYQSSTDREFPRPAKITEEAKTELLGLIEPVRFIQGETILTSKADSLFGEIYTQHKKNWPDDERVQPFYERLPDHILRLAMLLSISENPQTSPPTVAEKHIDKAKEILDWVHKYLPRIYSHLGGTQYGTDHHRIFELIRRNGGQMEEKELGRRMSSRLSKKQLQDHLETMMSNNVISRVQADPWEGKVAWKLLRKIN